MKGNKVFGLAKNLLLKLQGLSRTQAIIAAVSAVVAVGGIGTGGYLAYEHSHQPQEVVAEAEATEDTGVATEALEIEPETIAAEVLLAEETETAELEKKELSLVGTSIEKDLKIKVQDQKDKLVAGEAFSVSVKKDKKGAKAATYKDEDKDGIIYIDELEAGNYIVDLAEIEGYEIKKGSIKVKVKDKIEYKAVDVEAEIKSESEVNTAVEDTAVNNVPVESTLTDTVPLIDSTAKATSVAKADVDTSGFTKATAGSENISATLQKKQKTESTGSTETPGSSESESQTPGSSESESQTPGSSESESQTPGSSESESQMPSEGGESVSTTEMARVYVERNDISRVGTANGTETVVAEAVVAMPKNITVYNSTSAASNSYTIQLSVTDSSSIIKSISWSSADTAVASLSATSGNSVTVKAGKTGSTQINVTVTYVADEKGNTATATLQSVVTVSDFTDSTTQLND